MIRRWGQLLLPVFLLAACGGPAMTSTPGTPAAGETPLPSTSATQSIVEPEASPSGDARTSPTPRSSPTPTIEPMPIPTPAGLPNDVYVVQEGDTLGNIAYYECGCELDELVALNHIEDPSSLQIGQPIKIPVNIDLTGPEVRLLPDSEVVYSPAYLDFDVADFIQQQGGYLADYTEHISGQDMTSAQIVELIAQNFSIGPRVLLALLEYQGGWVTGTPSSDVAYDYPISLGKGGRAGLYFQLGWAADSINEGYYGYKRTGTLAIRLADLERALAAQGLNAGTVGVQNVLALTMDWDSWQQALGPDGFMRTYRDLFGEPDASSFEPVVPATLTQPSLSLPWEPGHTWYLSGGPHGAWLDGSAWAALDFAPPDVMGHCGVSGEWATAAAPGLVIRSQEGQVLIDLDEDGHEQTGWVLFYLHIAPEDQVPVGTQLALADRVGHPSCYGGEGDSSHLHIARRYNGEWIAADGPVPFVLSGWQAVNGIAPYDGELVRGDQVRRACECWENEVNGVVADGGLPE